MRYIKIVLLFIVFFMDVKLLISQKFIGGDPYESVLPDSYHEALNDSIKKYLPEYLYKDFKERLVVINIRLIFPGVVDTASILKSSGSAIIDTILISVISKMNYNYPEALKNFDYISLSIPILKRNVISNNDKLWKFEKYFK
ncbi:MAG: hypothetical protein H0Z29_07950 [Candidatus Marinimicrobia bacterium]|nr:hypothetical protein [Candidatus Neomarinimicrobiota bacterium]